MGFMEQIGPVKGEEGSDSGNGGCVHQAPEAEDAWQTLPLGSEGHRFAKGHRHVQGTSGPLVPVEAGRPSPAELRAGHVAKDHVTRWRVSSIPEFVARLEPIRGKSSRH
jgi:hypothetical protein